MRIFKEVSSLKNYLQQQKNAGKKIGFVPTMGSLHQGHLALLNQSIPDNDITLCSIFVNPTQFNKPKDYELYPRNSKEDLAILEEKNCDAVFIPDEDTIYPQKSLIQFDLGYLDQIMEGLHRPGHFKGVVLVVIKLLNLILPENAYFGLKDLQQFTIIKKTVEELFLPVNIIGVNTVREENGLALSSRNKRLDNQQKEIGLTLFKSLQLGKENLMRGESVNKMKESVVEYCGKQDGFDLEYFEIVNRETLMPIQQISEHNSIALCIAGNVGDVRLIDNFIIDL